MLCPDCQTKNPDGSNFCLNCSKRIGRYCIRCNVNLPAEAKFCNKCGRPVSPVKSSVVTKTSVDEVIALLECGQHINLEDTVDDLERTLIDIAMRVTGEIKSKTANLLGINRTTLIEKLKRGQKDPVAPSNQEERDCEEEIALTLETLMNPFSPGQEAIVIKLPESTAQQIILLLQDRGIEAKIQKTVGEEVEVRVENPKSQK